MREQVPVTADYRDKVLYALAIVATVVILPFSIANLFKGFVVIGALSLAVVAVLVVDAIAIYRGRRPPLPMGLAFAIIVLGVVVAVWQRGLMSTFWTFPAILLFHFVLDRKLANAFNITLVAIVGALVWSVAEPDFALRIIAAQILTIAFTNVFSYAVAAEQRKENEQRRRLDVLVRATQAGFFEWERQSDTAIYSARLKEMLGYPADADTSGWPPFSQFIHPEDRAARVSVFQKGARTRGEPGGVRRNEQGEHRLLDCRGETLWVHVEGLFIHGPDGRVTRYIAAMSDVTERHRQQEALRTSHHQIEVQAKQLRDQNEELRAAIRVREEVERIARHDLKTPLNSIVAVPRMLRERRALDAREEELLGMVEGAAYRMLDLVNLSIDLYRMEQGEYRFSPRAVDLAALVATVWREVRAHADTKELDLALLIDGAAAGREAQALAWGEPLLCYSILANLLKNALEASPDRGRVTVSIERGASEVVLTVHNAGRVPEDVSKIFFTKYATHGKAGGFGLGTYSARLMSRVQEGDLSMTSSEQAGTTLTLRLRALPQNARSSMPGLRPAERAREAAALPSLRVLIVDDDDFNIMFMRGNLPCPPLIVDAASNGRAALSAVRKARPDVIFMDLEMPIMDGFAALAAIRRLEADAGAARITIVAFTSFDDETTRQRCVAAGFDGYLAKPAPKERIHEMLQAIAAGSSLPTAQGSALPPARADDPVRVDADLADAMPGFLRSREALVGTLQQALSAGDRERARATAHKLAGSFALYGFHWAAAASRALHGEALHAPLDTLLGQCAALRQHIEGVRIEPEKAAAGR